MPRFFFDVFDGHAHNDETGHDLTDTASLSVEIRKVVADVVLHGGSVTSAIISVRDESNKRVATASLSLAISYPDTRH